MDLQKEGLYLKRKRKTDSAELQKKFHNQFQSLLTHSGVCSERGIGNIHIPIRTDTNSDLKKQMKRF